MQARYRRKWPLVVLLAVASATAAGCGAAASPRTPRAASSSPVPSAASTRASAPPPVTPASVHANELGFIPVLMYHQLLARPRGAYDQTPAQFRSEISSLYAHGYRSITAADLVAGHIDVAAGRKPMVLTFDDATRSQYAELPDGAVDPRCAVGILFSVARRYGENRPVATFFVNGKPFGDHPGYLRTLAGLGMELGDHTLTHANLRLLDRPGVQAELAAGQRVITDVLPGAPVTTMALPFGSLPRDRALARSGTAGGTAYDFAGVFAVGSNPAPSPFSASFDPTYVPRIRSGERSGDQTFTSSYWLPQLYSGKVAPFVSDGDPAHVSFPKALASRLAPKFASLARPY